MRSEITQDSSMLPIASDGLTKGTKSIMGFPYKSFAILLVFFPLNPFLNADESTQQRYLPVYIDYQDGERLEKQNDFLGALVKFNNALVWLEKIHQQDIHWEQTLVRKKIKDCQDQIVKLNPLALEQVREQLKIESLSPGQVSQLFVDATTLESSRLYGGAQNKFVTYLTTVELLRQADSSWNTPEIAQNIKQALAAIDRLASLEIEMLAKSERENGATVQ